MLSEVVDDTTEAFRAIHRHTVIVLNVWSTHSVEYDGLYSLIEH